MGARVVNALTVSYWADHKPADYKGQDLDRALKAYESVAGKTVKIPSNLIPPVPKSTITDIDDCIAKLKSAITELDKGKVILNQIVTTLQAVQAAGGKASADLTKLSKGKNVDETEYKNAATSANTIASLAADALNDYKSLFQNRVAARFQRAEVSPFSAFRHVGNVPPQTSGTDSNCRRRQVQRLVGRTTACRRADRRGGR